MEITIEQMEQALREINFFVGGLTDAGIEYYYNKMVNEGKIQTTNDMKTLKATPENLAKIETLKQVSENQWEYSCTHDTLDKALAGVSLYSGANSGWYKPVAVKIKDVQGIFMINEDGGLNFESRVIEVDGEGFEIQHLTMAAYNEFEQNFEQALCNAVG